LKSIFFKNASILSVSLSLVSMKNFYLYLFCVLILPEVILSQRNFTQELIEYRNQFLPEKVFVHTDKEIYLPGESIWLAAYLMDGQTHQPGGFSASITIVLENVNHEVIDGTSRTCRGQYCHS
jgi:hypothetical protein